MNPKIKELAMQAYEYAVAESKDGANVCRIGSDYFIAMERERFAELIIQECATLAYDGPNGILEHFGVEV